MAKRPTSERSIGATTQGAGGGVAPTFEAATPTKRRRTAKGPETRDTLLHRRQEVMRVSVRDLKNLTAFSQEERLLFGAGQFFWAGGLWLGAEKLIEIGWSAPTLPFCGLAILFGTILSAVGWRQMQRRTAAIDELLNEVEEAEKA